MNSKVSGDPLHADLETADCLSRHSTMTTSVSVAPSASNNCIVVNQARPAAEDSHGLADQTGGRANYWSLQLCSTQRRSSGDL